MRYFNIQNTTLFICIFFITYVTNAQYDVALQLKTINTTPVKYKTSVPFTVTVHNQSTEHMVQNVDVIVKIKNGFVFDPSINTIWTPDPMIPNAFTSRITTPIDPLANELITINLKPQPGLDSTLWDISAEIYYVEDIMGNDVSNMDLDSPHDKNSSNDGGGLIGAPSDDAINGNGTGAPNTADASTDEDDHDVSYVRIYDVALKKVLVTNGPHKYGDVLQFNTIVYNQGNENTGLVIIQELIPEGYIWNLSLNTPGWSGSAPKPKYAFDNLKPGDSIVIPVKLILSSEQFDNMAWNNYTEIFSVRDRADVNAGPNEADSTPNSNSLYENEVLPGSPFDNQLLGNGQSENEDEDDHDVAAPRIFDLAIKKERLTSVPSYSYIQDVTYVITVYNQGNVDASSVTITDTIPCGLEFLPANNPGWSLVSPGKVSFTSNMTIAGATFKTFNLVFGVNPCYINPKDGWTNYIEISNATPADGGSNADIDGTFDSNLRNDFEFNNYNNNDVIDKTNVGEDEDNHDLERIQVVDLALKKILVTPPPYSYGQNLNFKITLYNQGNVTLTNIKVKDYVPQGFQYLAVNTTNGWNPTDTTYLITSKLRPTDSIELMIQLRLQQGDSRKDWINYAHIINLQDTVGNNRFDDADSYPLLNPTEASIEPGGPEDNNIYVLGPSNQNRDEDDHDPAGFEVMDLRLDKKVKNPVSIYQYGDPITFAIDVINEAGTAASLIEVTDYLPCGYTFSTSNNLNWSQSGSQLKYVSMNPLSAGDTLTLELNLTVVQCSATTPSSWRNKAEISMSIDSLNTGLNDIDSQPDSNPNNDPIGEDDIDSTGIKIFDLALDKIPPAVTTGLKFGNQVTFTIAVTNQGNITASNVVVTDYLPCGLSFSPAGNSGWTVSGQNVNYTIATLSPGQTVNVPLILTVVSCANTNAYRNIAEISDARDGGAIGNDVDSTPDLDPNNDPPSEDDHDFEILMVDGFDLALDKTILSAPINPAYGSTLTYNIRVKNDGIVAASNVQIVDYKKCGYAFSTAGNTGWSQNGDKLYYTIAGPIAPGAFVDIALQLQLQYCSNSNFKPYSNKAEISISSPDYDSTPDDTPTNDPPGEDDIDSTEYDVFDLALVKTIVNPQSSYNTGQTVVFNITVTNEGTYAANNVKVTDYLPCGLILATTGNNGWILNNGNGYYEYTIPSLNVGQSVTISIQTVITPCNTQDAYKNIAEISAGDLVTGGSGKDVDSTPDTNPNNDPEAEDDSDSKTIVVNLISNIGDFVWNDANGNGLQDNGEQGISGVTVQLYNASGQLIATTSTNGSGLYNFMNVLSGNYYIKFMPTSLYSFINANTGSNDNIDSDVTAATGAGTTATFFIASGVTDNSFDAGLYICSQISGIVWYDIDKDDVNDITENGIDGLEVQLYRMVNGVWALYASTVTKVKPNTPSTDGYYSFCVPPGNYYIKFIMPPLGLVLARANVFGVIPLGQSNEHTNDSDATNTNGSGTTPSFMVQSNQVFSNIGAGYYPMATAGNLVWEDSNINGLQDPGEPKVASVLVEAFDENNQKIGQAVTDNNGIYKIDYLGKNNYYLKFTPPQGYMMTLANMADENNDSDVDNTNGANTTQLYAFLPDVNYTNIDAGLAFGVLPVKYNYIRATYVGNGNKIEWQTGFEINADKFYLQRFNPASSTFESIAILKAKGQSASPVDYTYIDQDITYGIMTYRIEQVDFDGQSSFSDEVQVYVAGHDETQISIYPNPAKDKISITLPDIDKLYQVQFFTAEGKLVKESSLSGLGKQVIQVNGLVKGMYNVVITSDSNTFTQKLIISE